MNDNLELTVVLPVYNEEEIVATVIEAIVGELTALGCRFVLRVYNDGSSDNTLAVVTNCASHHHEVEIIDKPNTGHGPTILRGYREADTPWLFQIDSDNEMDIRHFGTLWENRDRFDFLSGRRKDRHSPLSRKIVSFVSRLTVHILYGGGLYDVNTPFRLFRREMLIEDIRSIPADTFAPNVIIAGLANRKKLRLFETDVPHTPRNTGTVSIKKLKLLKSSIRAWWQTVAFRFIINR